MKEYVSGTSQRGAGETAQGRKRTEGIVRVTNLLILLAWTVTQRNQNPKGREMFWVLKSPIGE